jgi:hypothetical protein
MRSVVVVTACELAEHGCGVLLVDDQKTVEEFAADSADEAFRDRVRARRAHGVLTIWMSMAAKTALKAAVNLAARSRIRNRKRR